MSLEWSDIDKRAVDTIRVLAADAVQNTGNGHPGTAMSLAPIAYLLWQHVMRHDPKHSKWIARDRFILSCGHSSLTLYIQLYLAGYKVHLKDLQSFRKWGSITPGHPEYGLTDGVEVTTGPLGQGLGNAVGMAMASRYEKGLFDPDTPLSESIFNHYIYTIASDGDISEGVSSEASSLAGVQGLGNLIVIYDDNRISIEGDTRIALQEDVLKRYEAYGWHTQSVDFIKGNEYIEDVGALYNAINNAKLCLDKPSIIKVRTIIAWPAPNAQNTGKAHGAALGVDEVKRIKRILNFDDSKNFVVEEKVLKHTRKAITRGKKLYSEWNEKYKKYMQSISKDKKQDIERILAGKLPKDHANDILYVDSNNIKKMATRKASGIAINYLANKIPELWGGSADLAESNNTTIVRGKSFLPEGINVENSPYGGESTYGRVIHFGVREHGMGAIINGILLHGNTIPYCATFLTFSDYMRGSIRLAALMELPAIYIFTHDSIGLGEDGPTHQPIEHLAALRAIPGLNVIRPTDANEVIEVWLHLINNRNNGPSCLSLSRQDLPVLSREDNGNGLLKSAKNAIYGGYVISEQSSVGPFDILIIATGSEVQIALEAQAILQSQEFSVRVVAMPCLEWFEKQDENYRNSVIPSYSKVRVAIEAGLPMPWYKIVGSCGKVIGIDSFGASAACSKLYEEYGLTVKNLVKVCLESYRSVNDNLHNVY